MIGTLPTLILYFMALNVAVAKDIILLLKPTLEQEALMNTKEGNWQVRGELARPLSPENLEELEKITGVQLIDSGFFGLGGRTLRVDSLLSSDQMKYVIKSLNSLPWIKLAVENFSMNSRVSEYIDMSGFSE